MILEIILTIIVVLAIGYIINICEDKIKRNKRKISFRESMDLAEMPVITLYQGDKKFNFLLDTGSNYSHISKEAAKGIQGTVLNASAEVSGVGGKGMTSSVCRTTLSYKDVNYNIDLHITDHLTDTFNSIKSETGVQVHGLIGNTFFQKHKYILDFKELVAYSKE